MKLALIFVLSTLVVISHQQFYQQRPTSRGMLWWLPYYSPQRVLNDYQPVYNDQPAEELPFTRQSSSSGSVNYFQASPNFLHQIVLTFCRDFVYY